MRSGFDRTCTVLYCTVQYILYVHTCSAFCKYCRDVVISVAMGEISRGQADRQGHAGGEKLRYETFQSLTDLVSSKNNLLRMYGSLPPLRIIL